MAVGVIIVGVIVAGGYQVERAYNGFRLDARAQYQLRTLSHYLCERAASDNGTFPAALGSNEKTEDEDHREISVKDLLVDPATGESFVYRTVTAKGERLRLPTEQVANGFTHWADRVILWRCKPDHKGNRLVLMNDLSIQWIENSRLDFTNQKVAGINK